ncbi:L-seryl-tRNA(Sec) selenium transferase [Kibdelosporangium phytohabitans]|uniref:L-seryl-tRNA(Sec) selenium transferase n=1 Tax=Kibdelosporangium phytohabitans TaxID=860235 RepID=A0A0N9HTU9_9PSEU|nr:L-seryl-tRNA(Sec) selenium transferase [Kibdelosporangium phytohabitans]ALG10668.1 L-seryl-tRNA(Sec) selenium transferase [Kibdelosporangium phytohabitans]MBE1461795.1 L-seryl-tRNA(Ser) seleniumtransferase [Kibdelosporangium phytohabitans]
MTDPRRLVPRTDALLADPRLAAATRALGGALVKQAVVEAQQRARSGQIPPDAVADAAVAGLPVTATSLRAVINATGVVVHTNLGRAPLSEAARAAVIAAAGCTDVEFDLASGQRARRGRATIAALADAVPRAGAVHVVNNNAAALLLCGLVLAAGREIVVSRGELVEIGDGFRIPELLAASGATLREVGTTNRVHLRDYAEAIGEATGFVLKVHPSNFRVTGFTREVGVAELATLGPPVVVDIGSGLLRPHPLLPDEPDAATTLAQGASLVTASGDKLLGGPQAGLLFGDSEIVERLRRHPAARAMRVDKLTLAALEATVRGPEPPVAAMLTADVERLRERVWALVKRLDVAEVHDTVSAIGGGGAPGVELPSVAVSLPSHYAEALRRGTRPVVGRVERGRCLLDLRTVHPDEDEELLNAVLACT